MKTHEEVIKSVMKDWKGLSVHESLCKCINNTYDGDIHAFINSEWHCVKDNCLHIMWYDEGKTNKISYSL